MFRFWNRRIEVREGFRPAEAGVEQADDNLDDDSSTDGGLSSLSWRFLAATGWLLPGWLAINDDDELTFFMDNNSQSSLNDGEACIIRFWLPCSCCCCCWKFCWLGISSAKSSSLKIVGLVAVVVVVVVSSLIDDDFVLSSKSTDDNDEDEWVLGMAMAPPPRPYPWCWWWLPRDVLKLSSIFEVVLTEICGKKLPPTPVAPAPAPTPKPYGSRLDAWSIRRAISGSSFANNSNMFKS